MAVGEYRISRDLVIVRVLVYFLFVYLTFFCFSFIFFRVYCFFIFFFVSRDNDVSFFFVYFFEFWLSFSFLQRRERGIQQAFDDWEDEIECVEDTKLRYRLLGLEGIYGIIQFNFQFRRFFNIFGYRITGEFVIIQFFGFLFDVD